MNLSGSERLAVLLAGALAFAGSAHGQQEGADANDPGAENEVMETVVVTGSRISGAGESVSPVVSVGQTEFQDNPTVQLADFLVENITANNGQITLTDESNEQGRATGARQVGINLWSLGAENTLTLLNGSRLVVAPAPYSSGWFVTDANSIIPGIAMQRVDVLLDGGSAIYGTDAVAGVVNFVPRYGFEGVEFRAQTELYPDSLGDTTAVSVSGMYGTSFNDDRGSFIVAFDYRETFEEDAEELGLNHANIPQFSGGETAADYEALFEGGGAYMYSTPAMGMGMGAVPGIPLSDPLCGRTDLVDAPYYWLGEVVPVGIGMPDPADEGTCAGYPEPDTDGRDSNRYTVFSAFSYDLNDEARVSLELGFSDRRIDDRASFNTNTGSSNDIDIPATHPGVLYNQTLDPTWASVAGTTIQGGVNEFPVGYETWFGSDTQTYNLRGGLEIDITDKVGLKLGVSKGEAESDQVRHTDHLGRYENAINGLGGPGCDPLTGTPGQGDCMYYNPFISALLPDAGSLGLANSSELMSWMIDPARSSTRYYETDLFAIDALLNVETDWSLGGGEIAFVVGAEYREESSEVDYSEDYKTDGVLAGITTGLVPFEGSDTVTAVFTEFALPFTDTFSMQAALRYDNYESVGSTTNPKLGFNWQPSDRVTIRGAYGTSFKAPTIVHTNDSVGTASIPTGPTGGRRGGQPVTTIINGDPAIAPQEADHWSIGGDFVLLKDAGALRNLSMTLSYVSFEFDDRIVLLQERDRLPASDGVGPCGTVVDGAYDVFFEFEDNDPGKAPCFEGVDSNGNGTLERTELTTAYRTFTNLALAELNGIDAKIRMNMDTGIGDLDFTIGGTYTLDYTIQDNPLEPPVDALGKQFVLGAINATPVELQMNAILGMRWGNSGKHHTQLTGRYKSETVNADTGDVVIGDQQTYDLRHAWTVNDNFTVGLTVRNLFENAPSRPGDDTPPVRDGVRSFFLNVDTFWGQ